MLKGNRWMAWVLLTGLALNWGAGAEQAKLEGERPLWYPRVAPVDGKNLVPNGGFECGPGGWSSVGKVTAWIGDMSGLFGVVETTGGQEGTACLRIDLGPGKTPVTYGDGWPSARVVQAAPLAANIGWLDVEKGQPYTLSAYLRADRPGVKARLIMRFATDPRVGYFSLPERTQTVTLTDQWARYTFTVNAEEPQAFVGLGPDLSETPDAAATVWIDAVQFEKGSAATDFVRREPVELAIDTGRFGNVYDQGRPVEVAIQSANASGAPARVKVEAELEDYFGKALPATSCVLEIPAGQTAKTLLPLGLKDTGYYRGTVSWDAGGVKHAQQLRLAVIQPYGADSSPFGVNHAPSTADLCSGLKQAGVVWVRECSFDWDQLEPEQGKLSFERPDAQVNRLLDVHMKLMALLPPYATAAWASSAPADVEKHLPEPLTYPAQWVRYAYAPKDPQNLANFIEKTVTHFKDRMRHWEFYNEPVFTVTALPNAEHKLPGANYTIKDYVDLLALAHKTMKKADPNCCVIGGMQGPPLAGAKEFIEAGGLDHADAYSIHPYGFFNKTPEVFIAEMDELLRLMDASKAGRKPIWITECGYYGTDSKPWTPWVVPPGHFSASVQLKDERIAADYSVRHALIMLAHNVERIFYHQGVEGELNNTSWNMDNCLQVEEGQPRKFYPAIAALANLLGPAPKFAAPLAKPESVEGNKTDSVYGYAFQCGTRAVLAAWAPETEGSTAQWTLNAPAGAEVFDIMGKVLAKGPVELGESPVYLTSSTVAAQELAKACQLRPGK